MTTTVSMSAEQLIAAAGYVSYKATYMHQVLSCAMETLRHAEDRLINEWGIFSVKKGAIRRPKSRTASGPSIARPDENALTYELSGYVEQYMRALPIGHEYREVVRFHCEKPLHSDKLAGSYQKRLDMRFEASVPNGPELVLEAKPLFSHADISKRYLGEEGLGRFMREDEPFTRGEFGGLLGYVEQGSTQTWHDSIRDVIATLPECSLVRTVHHSGWPGLYCSQHPRSASRPPIWMLHLLVTYPTS